MRTIMAMSILAAGCLLVGIVWGDESATTEPRAPSAPSSSKALNKWRDGGPIARTSSYWGLRYGGDMTREFQEDFALFVETVRRDGAVVRKVYRRLTVSGDVLLRERWTTEVRRPGGTRTFETRVVGHHDAAHCPGERKFEVDDDGIQQWLADAGRKKGIDPDDPGEACPLDDRSKVPDEELEKFAATRWLTYAARARPTFIIRQDKRISRNGDCLWLDKTARAARFVYGENPSPAPYRRSRNPDDEVPWRNTWHFRMQAQAVDNDGKRRTDLPRVVWFIHSLTDRDFGNTIERRIFVVHQEMDYTSGPRPKIKSYSIEHYLSNTRRMPPKPGAWDLGPDVCKEYEVQVEDLQDGDSALHGEWITKVVPRGEAFRKFAEAQGFQALLSPDEQQEATPRDKQPEKQPKP